MVSEKIQIINRREIIYTLVICTHISHGLYINDFLCELKYDVLILEILETIPNEIDIGDSKHV